MNHTTDKELEDKLLTDKSFQHILKFAPKSQRELMTFELARYFESLLTEARIDELEDFLSKWHNFGLVMVTDELDTDKERVIYQERKPVDRLLVNRITSLRRELKGETA